MKGAGGADSLSGGSDNDNLSGGDGNDRLNGGFGADTMVGGNGDDVYVVNDAGDTVDETDGSGIDRVESLVSFSLASDTTGDVENLALIGFGNLNGVGNALANTLVGNNNANNLNGNSGADLMQGRGGNDSYVVNEVGRRRRREPGGLVRHRRGALLRLVQPLRPEGARVGREPAPRARHRQPERRRQRARQHARRQQRQERPNGARPATIP